jgi:hypothetical protein
VQARSITRGIRAAFCAAALLGAVAGAVAHAQAPAAPARPADPPASAAQWREAPEFLALFVPRPYRDSYRAFVSPLTLDAALRVVASDAGSLHAAGSWMAHAENPVDAFGTGGTYDRGKLARLFGSQRPVVARGPRGRHGLVDESWTLVGPYPSADLSRLEPGTLLIILRIP